MKDAWGNIHTYIQLFCDCDKLTRKRRTNMSHSWEHPTPTSIDARSCMCLHLSGCPQRHGMTKLPAPPQPITTRLRAPSEPCTSRRADALPLSSTCSPLSRSSVIAIPCQFSFKESSKEDPTHFWTFPPLQRTHSSLYVHVQLPTSKYSFAAQVAATLLLDNGRHCR